VIIMAVLKTRVSRGACILAGLFALSACAYVRRQQAAERQAASAPRARQDHLNDGNVVAMFLAANNTDVSYAQVALAPNRTKTGAILAFAHRMLDDHNGLAQAARDLIVNTGIVAEDNAASLDFRDESAAKRDTLRELTGAKFDSFYIANEVRYHTRLLTTLDSVLIPAARNSDLKSLLTGVRPAVAAHLEHAERVQAGLGK
jgi:putative membrane protein